MHENTEFTTSREIEAIQIPMGNTFTIPAGTPGVITQSLGGSYTIATYHGLARVSEKDIDALGLEPGETPPTERTTSNGEVSEEDVWNQLKQCYDPEIPVNIVDLGLVYDCKLTKKDDGGTRDRKSTRLNSSHVSISYAVFCLKKKKKKKQTRHEDYIRDFSLYGEL